MLGRDSFFAITGIDITVWTISALLAVGVGWSRYAKWKTRDTLVRELAAMDPVRREKMLTRLNPKLAMEIREQLMERSHYELIANQATISLGDTSA